ncbi:hypothetical protein N8J89_34705 [Crossiella sp. CA-258035]|uniref:hypothetical protein n=1 Tax=Crossiella sp. CA-258035 TaxID=2981138 RepID=UPI0024BC3015|nr:hypothetical protein [Crossiella sp. CA-258035]WHT18213.1 hypothetical protein N8J89_34705 [Crossiella sp. CA-258035]
MWEAGAGTADEVLTRLRRALPGGATRGCATPAARPECPVSPDGRHCQSATGAPVCQFCGAPM